VSGVLKLYKSYVFTDRKDPVIDQVRTAAKSRNADYATISAESGVSATTVRNWFEGDTCRPQYATVAAVLGGLGYELVIRERETRVVPIHARARKGGPQ